MLKIALNEIKRCVARTLISIVGYSIAVMLLVLYISLIKQTEESSRAVLTNTGTHFIAFSLKCCAIPFVAEEFQDIFVVNGAQTQLLSTKIAYNIKKSPLVAEKLFGKAWVDRTNGSVLKIEWEESSIENYEEMQEFAESLRAKPRLSFSSEYRFEKNGIRFPSKYSMKENYQTDIDVLMGFRVIKKKDLLEKSELRVEYSDYQFFIVETEVKY